MGWAVTLNQEVSQAFPDTCHVGWTQLNNCTCTCNYLCLSYKYMAVSPLCRLGSPHRSKSASPDNEQVKSKTSSQTSKSTSSRVTKTSKASIANQRETSVSERDGSNSSQRSQREQLNNVKSPVRTDSQCDRQHERTHNNLHGSGDNDKIHQSSRSNTRYNSFYSISTYYIVCILWSLLLLSNMLFVWIYKTDLLTNCL